MADAVFHDPEQLPVRFGWRLGVELRNARIEIGCAPLAGLVEISMAARAGIAEDFHPCSQVLAGGRDRVVELWSLTSNRRGEGSACQSGFPSWRIGSGVDRRQSKEKDGYGNEWRGQRPCQKARQKPEHTHTSRKPHSKNSRGRWPAAVAEEYQPRDDSRSNSVTNRRADALNGRRYV